MGLQATIRHKGKEEGILCEADLEDVLRDIAMLDIAKEQAENELKLAVDELTVQTVARCNDYAAKKGVLVALAETFVTARRTDLLGKAKSKAINFGKYGFRKKADELKLPKKNSGLMAALVAKIREIVSSVPEFPNVTISQQEYVKQGAVSGLTKEQLSLLGLKRIEGKDEFFIEPDRERIKEVSNV